VLTLRRISLLAVLLTALTSCATQHQAKALTTSVCDIWADPERFVGKQLALDSRIESDARHLSLLMGQPCERGLRFYLADIVPKSTADAFSAAIYRPWPGTEGKAVAAHFEGRLLHDPGEKVLFPYYFEVTSVDHLEIAIGTPPW
jgi:hypothetical protein